MIGATIVALGTSLPELAVSYRAFSKGQPGLALGTVVGSGFTNISLILGAFLIVTTFTMDMRVYSDLVTFSLLTNMVLWYFLTGRGRLGRREGLILLFLYAVFLSILGQ